MKSKIYFKKFILLHQLCKIILFKLIFFIINLIPQIKVNWYQADKNQNNFFFPILNSSLEEICSPPAIFTLFLYLINFVHD